MKIVFTIQHLGSGGAEKVASLVCNYLAREGNDVTIILTSYYLLGVFYELEKNIKVISLYDHLNVGSSKIKKAKVLKTIISEINPDVVISFLSHVIALTYSSIKHLKTKFVVSERNDPSSYPKNKILRILRNKAFKHADGHVYQTEFAKRYYSRINDEGVVISNPVTLSCNEKWSDTIQKKKEIIMCGSKKPEKNRVMAYKAFSLFSKKHNDYVLRIFGESTKNEDEDILKELGISDNVVFEGKNHNWHKEAINSKMFILTSDFEGMPNSLLEALSLQIPCISTDCPIGGPKELTASGEKGVLVKVGDFQELADKMCLLAESTELCNKLSSANNDTFENYSIENIGKLWSNYLKKVINNG